jgi:LmbE family N-acetylglucosaminyl deacetylase
MGVSRRVLVIAPHPDDEVLGVGGTMARLAAEGAEVHVVVMTRGYPPLFTAENEERCRAEAIEAHRLLNVAHTEFLNFPAAELDTVPHHEVNAQIGQMIAQVRPETLFVPFVGDIHRDHQRVFLSAMVAARPNGDRTPKTIYAYETLSETNWSAPYLTPGFHPTVFVDIAQHLDTKIRAMQAFASEIKEFPHERSAEAIRALAMFRGSTAGCRAAEALVLIRDLV